MYGIGTWMDVKIDASRWVGVKGIFFGKKRMGRELEIWSMELRCEGTIDTYYRYRFVTIQYYSLRCYAMRCQYLWVKNYCAHVLDDCKYTLYNAEAFETCGCMASHRITITSTPPRGCINDEHSQTQYDLILQLHLTIAIAITIDSGPHNLQIQKYPPLKNSPTRHYCLKNNISSKTHAHSLLSLLSFMPRENIKTPVILHPYYPCILPGLAIPHRAWSFMIGFGLGDLGEEPNKFSSKESSCVA